MDKRAKLVVIITSICTAVALLGIGIWFLASRNNEDKEKPKNPTYSAGDYEGDWTDNY